jgi:hypothetical protein
MSWVLRLTPLGGAMLVALAYWPIIHSAAAQEYFNGYPCTEDCSGHQAGYDWAEQNEITNPGDCGGSSQSFIEGCESYAEENESSSGTGWQDDPDQEDSEDNEDSESDY